MYLSLSLELLFSLFLTRSLADLHFFPDGLVSENKVSSTCEAALTANVSTCPSSYVLHPVRDFGGPFENPTLQELFCSERCSTALASYRSSVNSACANDPQPWQGIPANFSGDRMAAYQKRMCLKDPSSGEYCIDYFANYTLPDTLLSITDLPQAYKCSACYLGFLRAMQATPYSNYDESWVTDYQAIQTSCGVKYPSDVQPWPLNVTQDLPPDFQYSNDTEKPYCLSGKTVTVKSGTNCQTIAEANGVSTGTLRLINGLYPDCSNLIAGASLCLPMSCSTYKVQSGDNCWSISDALDGAITVTDLISYNPTLNGLCSNLRADENICIFPAAGKYTATVIPGVTPVQTDVYATATVAPPGPTAVDTTPYCGRYYQVRAGDECAQISLNNTITVSLFEAINPSINSACSNLFPGLWYCVMPTANWNQTSSTGPSVTVSPPAPTQTGTTGSCYRWYTVRAGDYCDLITSSYGLTFAQFQAWNKRLLSDCSNLVLGNAYCVKGSDTLTTASNPVTSTRLSSTSTSTSSKTSSTSTSTTNPIPGPTQAGISVQCSKYVKQTDGVYCYDMAAAASISLAQLYYWNPALNGDCSGLWAGYAYCIGISPPGPVQAGIVATCKKYVAQKDGVYCYDMAAAAGIALSDLYAWNPALNGDCSGLWAGYAYCVAG